MTATFKSKCPSDADIATMVRGDSDPGVDVVDHVGGCVGCQGRLESTATAGAKNLSSTIRGIDTSAPPSKSAFWPALNAVEAAVTREFNNSDTDPEDGDDAIDLSFLRPSPVPGRIGRLGDFEIIRAIGKGGMGVVLHAFDPSLQRDVAIKVLDPHLATNATARQRFCREARLAAAVTHDNVVTVYQVDEEPNAGLPFLVMQLVNGESLDVRLRRVGKLDVPSAVRLGIQAAAGLAAAHAGGLIHRDIKPGNILIERDTDKTLLTDFGLARATEDLKLTKTGMVAGTPLYMAPEQANGLDPDPRADLFSLGSVLYESLAGRPAFDARTPLAVLRRIADESHEPLRKLNPDVPAWLDEVVEGLLRKNPDERIPTARAVVEMLANHATCAIPKLVGTSGDHCTIVKSASQAIAASPPLRRFAATLLFGTFGIGALSGGVGTYLFAPPVGERIVTVEKEVPVPAPAPVVTTPGETGPAPLGVFRSQSGAVWSVSPDKDGTMLATGYESGRIQLWNVGAGRVTSAFDAHKGPIWAANYSADGTMLITASDDNSVKVRDLKSQKVIDLSHPNAVRAAVVHPDGKHVVTGDRNGILKVWNLETQAPAPDLSHGAAINSVALSPDKISVATSGTDGRIVLWDISPKQERRRTDLKDTQRGPVYGLAYNHDGTLLAAAGWDGTVAIWDTEQLVAVKHFMVQEEGVWAVDFSPCCKYLATGGQDGTVKIWDVSGDDKKSATLLATFSRHRGTVHTVRFFSDGKRLASGSRDGTAMVWDVSQVCGHP